MEVMRAEYMGMGPILWGEREREKVINGYICFFSLDAAGGRGRSFVVLHVPWMLLRLSAS
jgi:hypothetical protein